ncbi:aminoacyl-histidine dipeptidase [Sansalvadorimonas verongulae]|uniref:aminoacyl-histidine dipeptidase n=1 Tax=Sansalvadorimonas verongulae TaxID=2172824 RepID=UPI0012BCCD91|nr:aminoacyl-histidine dipeptidase [Sansalvadorimonas verongulae]MTI12224.1 aminoacyl-histidine dipeptidase [Sansalvadorimonas verongulae]
MSDIRTLHPQGLWQQFADICAIPHPSHHEEKITQHIIAFCESNKLDHSLDASGNIIIRKPATAGMENRRGVILQAHMDMVPEKNSDKEHDFLTDPIETIIDGDWVRANDTTLGADNGIGVAAAMAVLVADGIEHGPLEVLITSNEEDGMGGAQGLEEGKLQGDILFNLDTEDEGEIYVGCAGGVRIQAEDEYTPEALPEGYTARTLTLKGLSGGHSGCDIHLYRGNAIKLMVRAVKVLEPFDVRIASFNGGKLFNAIPRESFAVVALPQEQVAQAEAALDAFANAIANEYKLADPELNFTWAATDTAEVMPAATQQIWMNTLHVCPNGVLRMSDVIEGVTETSANLGVTKIAEGKIVVQVLPRSMVNSAQDDTRRTLHSLFALAGAKVTDNDGYPGWEPVKNSPVQQLVQDVHQKLFNKEAVFKVIHAGLECGLLGKKYPNWDMVSFGPTIQFPHSPAERAHIASVGRFWQLLVAALAEVPAA